MLARASAETGLKEAVNVNIRHPETPLCGGLI